MNRIKIHSVQMAVLICSMAGCAMPGWLKSGKDNFPNTGATNPLIRILPMWQPAEGVFDGRPSRGFYGQIFFLGQKDDVAPATVKGTAWIYVFDDQGTPEEQTKPIRIWKYESNTWNALLSKGPLGATYSVFIPYTRPGHHEAKCALRVCFTPEGSPPVNSEMLTVVLPGTKKKSNSEDDPTDSGDVAAFAPVAVQSTRRAHDPVNSLPTLDELQKLRQRRSSAPRLTAADRDRIIHEVQSRLESEPRGERAEFAPESTENPSAKRSDALQQTSERTASTGRLSRNPLADEGDIDPPEPEHANSEDVSIDRSQETTLKQDLDDRDSDGAPPSRANARQLRRQTQQKPSTMTGKGHLLEEAQTRGTATGIRRSNPIYTIKLPESLTAGS